MNKISKVYLKRIIGLAVLAIVTACDQVSIVQSTDWVLTNGRFYTVNDEKPWAEAVVIRDGVFIYAGENKGAQAFITEESKIIDLQGSMVIPGIVDAHTHPGQIELTRYETTFTGNTREEFLAELTVYAKENPGNGWLRGCCWPVQEFVDGNMGPDRNDLDLIFPDRPVWLISTGGHSFWLNSQALRELSINEDSKDPKFPVAMYKRDNSGRLTGWVKEGAAWVRVNEVFEVDTEIHEASMRAMLERLGEHGVTTLYDAGTKGFADRVYEFLSKLDKAGELPLRYEGTYRISIPENVRFAIPEMKRYREVYGGERLKFNTIKLFMDGIHENRSGAMLEPYADDPDYISDTILSVWELKEFLLDLHEERFDLHVHVIGDLATKRVLDAVEMAKKEVGDGFYPRVSLAHLQTVDPGDWLRFRELDVTANFTPWWSGVDVPNPIGAGLEQVRGEDTFRAKAIADAGGNVTFSSDTWNLRNLSPFLGIQVGHTRQYPREWLTPGDDPDAFLKPASEKMPIELLIQGYTINGAYQLRMENQLGSIETGKVGDLVILEENLFETEPHSISQIKPRAVIMAGILMYGNLD